jgi:hypothetical protein
MVVRRRWWRGLVGDLIMYWWWGVIGVGLVLDVVEQSFLPLLLLAKDIDSVVRVLYPGYHGLTITSQQLGYNQLLQQ